MEKTAILYADILDIIFEGRNKEYGAYELRRTYNKRMRLSIAVMLLVVLLLCVGQLLADRLKGKAPLLPEKNDVVLSQVDVPEDKPLPPPPAMKPPPQEKIQTIKVVTPRIVPDEQVPETEMPPVEEQENAKIDLVTNKDGRQDDGMLVPPDDGNRGIIAAPKPHDEDKDRIWTSVEIESSYPGGRTAWERFLKRNLHYPQAAQDIGVQGTVIVQFIVDREGNVSDVQAISGPAELRDEAVRVIKKSGKWTVAIQNGNPVPSFKKQPIGFQLEQE
jgi:protein TonB